MGRVTRRPLPELLVLGLTQGFWSPKPRAVPASTFMRHLWLTGATGSGKSTQGINLIYMVAAFPSKWGALILDLKDSLALDSCRVLPATRVNDICLFDAADRTYPPSFNPLAGIPTDQRSLAASELLSCLKRYFGTSWGDRQEHILRMVLLGLTEVPGASLLDISPMLLSEEFRTWALSNHVSNRAVHAFFAAEYPYLIGSRGATTNVQPILNKLSVFTAYPELARILANPTPGIQPRQIIDEGRIVCVNIPQGVLGEDASSFLASLFLAKFQLAAQSRVDTPQYKRRPFVLFADEMQNYAISSFDKLITEGRGYSIGVIAANQFDEQLGKLLQLTLEKNCAYKLCCSYAETTRQHRLTVVALQEKDPDGRPLSYPLLPLPPLPHRSEEQLAKIRAQSRAAICAPVAVVDAALSARHQVRAVGSGASRDSLPGRRPPRHTSRVQEDIHARFFEDEDDD